MKRGNLIMMIVGLLLMCGCNDFLNEEPDDRAKVETPTDIQELLVNAYPQATYHVICEMMADNVEDRGFGINCVTAVTDDEMYHWKDGTDSDTDSPFAVWTGWYEGIAAANHALRVIDSKSDPENYRPMRGEALLCRAFGHFLLVNLWAEHYDPATAETALGVPYVKEPETTAIKEYKRNTMKEVYDFIEEDLLRGLALIDDKIYTQPKYHFTKRAAHAFAARFYQYKGSDWDKVLYHTLQAAPDDFSTELKDLNAMSTLAEMEYMKEYTNPATANILLSVSIETYWNEVYQTCTPRSSRYVLTSPLSFELKSPNSDKNIQRGLWLFKDMKTPGNMAVSLLKSYAYFKTVSNTSTWGHTYLNVPMFTVEDVALTRIEAYAMQGDTTRAIRDMNRYLKTRTRDYNENRHVVTLKSIREYFRDARWSELSLEPHYKSELDSDPNKSALVKAVLYLRRIEFMQEGLRWFDIKRFHLPVKHKRHWERDYITLDGYDKRRALQIPQEAQKAGVVPNER